MQSISIEIINWERFNPRKDLTSTSWFRFQNNFFENHEFYSMNHAEICFWIYLLSLASKKQSSTIIVNSDHANRIGRFTEKQIKSSIKKLVELQCIVVVCNEHVTSTSRGQHENVVLHNVTERNETKQNETEQKSVVGVFSKTTPTAIACYSALEGTFRDRGITKGVQDRWSQAFPDAGWVCGEIQKALAWEASNPGRKKKNFAAFITRWMTKSWDVRKVGNGISSKGIAEIMAESGASL
jgi:hypothetical protein